MLIKILIALGLIVVVFFIVVSLQPSAYTVTRTATIAAPPSAVYPLIDDFHNWNAWSPWAKLDPAMKQVWSGAPAGVGAIYTWSGNDKAGEGRMTISENQPEEHVGIALEFTRPYVSSSRIDFTIGRQAAGSTVNWTMTGQNGFMLKAVSLFANMDKMVGPDFEKGLAQLKAVAEKSALQTR
jgi:hypothetical protein